MAWVKARPVPPPMLRIAIFSEGKTIASLSRLEDATYPQIKKWVAEAYARHAEAHEQ